MKSRTLKFAVGIVLLAAPVRLAAQQHHHYKLIDLRTLGGPTSYFSNGFDGILNNQGTAVGWADTSTPDPFPAFCFNPDCFVSHAFQSRNGVRTDLGTLPGGASSQAFWISANGLIVGNAQNGQIDPLIPGLPELRAVLWQNGSITDLGTLDGGTESLAAVVNTRGQVVGFAGTNVPDPFGLSGIQFRAFLWQSGTMQDLGTLGGNDAMALFINEAGQVAGSSYTNTTPNPSTGFPTQDPFFWEHGTMLDIGTLGGTVGFPQAFNNRGEVVGQSNLTGDLMFHPFLWTKTGGIQDLGTLGGSTGLTNWINDAGDIAGKADLPGPLPQNHDAVLWRQGAMIDLGTLPGDSCSNAYFVNSRGQVVGTSESRDLCLIPTGEHAFLWENGGPMVDLNSLIPPGSSLQLTFAFAINGNGEIVGTGVPSGCTPENIGFCGHAFVLIPCDENHPGVEGCDYSLVDEPAATTSVGSRPVAQNRAPANPGTTGAANPMMRSLGHRSTPWYRNLGVQPSAE